MTDELAYEQSIPNAWLASVPQHPFWLFAIARIIAMVATVRDMPDKCGPRAWALPQRRSSMPGVQRPRGIR